MNKKLVKSKEEAHCGKCKVLYVDAPDNHSCDVCFKKIDCFKSFSSRMYCSKACEVEGGIIIKEARSRDKSFSDEIHKLSLLDRVIYEAKRMYSKLFKS